MSLDPAFDDIRHASLADELDIGNISHLQLGDHRSINSLEDELGGLGGDLASELGGGMEDLASELAQGSAFETSLADQLQFQEYNEFHQELDSLSLANDSPDPSNLFQSNTEDIQQSIYHTQLFLNKLNNLSSNSHSEDTAKLELMASRLVKQLYEVTTERESQIRELREIDRQFSRMFSELPLLDVSETPDSAESLQSIQEEEEEYSLLSASSSSTTTFHRKSSSVSSDSTAIVSTTPSTSVPLSESIVTPSFSSLQTTTSSLLTSLNALHEHTQITKSSISDASRRLRSLKSVIQQWKIELEGIEKSRTWILVNQNQRFLPPDDDEQGTTDVKSWTLIQMSRFEKILNDAEEKAKRLLTPVSIQVGSG